MSKYLDFIRVLEKAALNANRDLEQIDLIAVSKNFSLDELGMLFLRYDLAAFRKTFVF